MKTTAFLALSFFLAAPLWAQSTPKATTLTRADVLQLDQKTSRLGRRLAGSGLVNNENIPELKAILLHLSALSWQRSGDPQAEQKRIQLQRHLQTHTLTAPQAQKLTEAIATYRKARGLKESDTPPASGARKKSTSEKAGEVAGEVVEAVQETVEAGVKAAQELTTVAVQVAKDVLKGIL